MARSGRRPADSGTREAIEAAARRQFSTTGFDRTSLRSIAAEAGVDPGLVSYFFGSKHELLVHVVDLPFDPDEVLPFVFAEGPEAAGTRLAAFIATALDTPDVRTRIVALVRAAASDPAAAQMVRDLLVERIVSRVVARLGVDDAPLRASLVGSQIVGVVVARHVLGIEPLASLPPESLAAALAPTLQSHLTGPTATRVWEPPDRTRAAGVGARSVGGMTTSPWLPITRDHPEVVGIDPDDDSRLEVHLTLSTVPPVEWAERFTTAADADTDTPAPTLKGKTVTIRPPDPELAAYVTDVDERIRDANTYFETEVLPEVDAQLAEQHKEEDEAVHDRDEDGRVRAARLEAQSL